MFYKDRQDAGIQLAEELLKYKEENPIILALPRGGVVLGFEIAKKLKAKLDIVVTRKIGAPFNPEFGVGAIAPNGIRILDANAIRILGNSDYQIEQTIERETIEMNRRIQLYRKDLAHIDIENKTVIIVDDGIATGVTTEAAVKSVKTMNPKKVILAVPVCSPSAVSKFQKEVDEFLCLHMPPDFYAVGAYYDDFDQVSDEEVIDLLQKAKQ